MSFRILINSLFCSLLLVLASCASGPARDAPPPQPDREDAAPDADATLPSFVEDAPLTRAEIARLESRPVRVALLLPLSGQTRPVGAAMRDAAMLALFDAYDPRLKLKPLDTAGTPEGARAAAQAAVDWGADIVVGPLLADSIDAAAPVLLDAGMPVLGLSNDRRVARPGVYLMGFMPDQEVARIIRHAVRAGHRRIAGLIPRNAYGERVLQTLGPALLDSGGDLAALARYDADADRLADPVRRLADYDRRRAAYEAEVKVLESLGDDLSLEILSRMENRETLTGPGFDAVLIAEGDPLVRTLAPLLPFYEIDPGTVQVLGTGLWDEPSLTREPPLRGARFAAPAPDRPRAFLARFKRLYDRDAPRIATLAYDAVSLAAHLARDPVPEDRFTRRALTDPAGFLGLDGAFRFSVDGIIERKLAVIAIRRDGFEVVDPAATDFMPQLMSMLRGVTAAN